jgi:uncharacterized protein (DUF1697 family)
MPKTLPPDGRRWIALLRAVNLGKRNRVPMAELKEVFERAGCSAVRTHLQSGNVVFAHEAPDRGALEAAIAEAFGVETVVILRSAAELRRIVDAHPFGDDTSGSVVAFLAAKPGRSALAALSEFDAAPDRVALAGGDVALHYPNGFRGARLTVAKLEQLLEVPATARNWRTVARLAELSGAPAA